MDQPKRRPTLAEMLSSSSSETTVAVTAPPPIKRRLTLAEMLKQSPLAGNTVPLAEAVESAQAAAAERQAAAERPAVVPQVAEPRAVEQFVADPAVTVPSETTATVSNRYRLYTKVEGKWAWQCDIDAATHADGMRQAIQELKPEHEACAIRLEQDEMVVRAARA